MKTIKFLSMAALALVGAVMTGCSNDDEIIETPQQPVNSQNVETLTTTVGFDEVAETRALTSGGVKTFAAGDKLALVYKNTSGQTVKTESAALPSGSYSKSATFTFELVNADKTKNVTYIYPASMAKSDGSVNYDALNSQNGTLATLSSSLDLATYAGAWDGISLPTGTLVNQLAVCALTLKNSDGSSPITSGLTQVTVSDGSNTYIVTPTSSTFGEDVIYVAIRSVTAALQYTATDGTKNYTKTATSREYAAGNFYNLGLRMVEPALALNLTSPAVGQVIGDDGKNYNYASLPGGVTAVAKICYVSGSNGLALALADEGNMNWSTAISTCAAHTPAFTNGIWKLATQDEWTNMITAAGGYEALRDGFSSVGGSNLLSNYYWSSTVYDSDRARIHGFYYGDWGYDDKVKDYVSVRACLAWTINTPGLLAGAFKINAGGTQVRFAQGNLQATWNGSTWSWAFATNQWDYIGNAAGNTSIDGDGTVSANNVTVDLFGWVGASSTWTGAAQYGISNSTGTNSTNGYGNNASEALKSDWGNTIGSGWRTLTSAEWTYLFNTRTVNGGTGSGKSYTLNATVGSKMGVVIYPDNYTGSVYSGSDWASFEAAGCVFLPAAGYRAGASVDGAGSYGDYWSSSPYTSDVNYAYYVDFNSGSLSPASFNYRSFGLSVRLVRQVE